MSLEQLREFDEEGAGVMRGLRRAVEPLALDQYRITVSPDSAVPHGVTVELTASDPSRQCAAVKMHVAKRASVIWITVGRGLDFEVPVPVTDAWRPFDLGTVDDVVEAIVSAAIRGNVNETGTLVDDEVVRSEGTITIGATEFPVSVAHGRPSGKGEPRLVRFEYRPYSA